MFAVRLLLALNLHIHSIHPLDYILSGFNFKLKIVTDTEAASNYQAGVFRSPSVFSRSNAKSDSLV